MPAMTFTANYHHKPARRKSAKRKAPAQPITQQQMRTAHLMLDKVEQVLATLEPQPLPADALDNPIQRAVARWTNDQLTLWSLCHRRTCRRAKCCRGLPIACLVRQAPELPGDVFAGAQAMLRGKRRGRAFHELRPEQKRALAALAEWRAWA